jgi:hypothetical protein
MDRIEYSDGVSKETQALLLAMHETVGDYSIEILRDSLGSRPLVNFDDVEDDDLLGLAYLKLDEVIREALAMKKTLQRSSQENEERAAWIEFTKAEREYAKHMRRNPSDHERADSLLDVVKAKRDALVALGVDLKAFQ